jgi:hypothetical protein
MLELATVCVNHHQHITWLLAPFLQIRVTYFRVSLDDVVDAISE